MKAPRLLLRKAFLAYMDREINNAWMHWTQEKMLRTANAKAKVNKNVKTETSGQQDKEEHMPTTGDSSQVCVAFALHSLSLPLWALALLHNIHRKSTI